MKATKPTILLVGAILLGVMTAAGAARARGGATRFVPQPAKTVDIDRYLGRWYEFARYDNWFERGCEDVTADYARRPDGLIDVVNTCRPGGTRRARVARGRARPVSGSLGAKLKVSFFGPFFVGNYWVLDHAEDYGWSIVGEPSGRFLWILTRDPWPPAGRAAELISRAVALGYDASRIRTRRRL